MMRPKFLSPRRGVLFAFALLTVLATISTIRPQQAAAAAAPVPKLPIVWADNNHQHAVDANNNVYYSAGTKGFFCNNPPIFSNVGTTSAAVSSGATADQGGHTYTSTKTYFENLGTSGASTFPGCVNGSGGIYPASYAWLTNTNSGTTYALVVPANWMGCTVNPQIEIINESKYECSNGGSGGFTYAAHAYIAEINKTTGVASGNPMVVSSMAVDTAKQTVVNGTVGSSTNSSTTNLSNSNLNDTTPPCEQNNDPFTAIICPIINGLEGIGDWIMSNLIQPFLVNSPIGTKATDPSYEIWSEFRVYGDILLVIVLLVVVLGQSINGGLVDAYTVRKTLPRVLVAAILINLSIYIVALGVDLSNVVGAGIGNLIIEPVKQSAQFQFTPNGLQIAGTAVSTGLIALFIGSIISAGVVMPAIIWVVVIVLIPALFALIAAVVTMIVLHGLILFLAVVSPVAFGLYALPNTEKRFRQWWDWFYRALLVYPIIMTIFAIADVMTVMIQNANNLNTAGGTAGSGHPLLTQTIQNVTAGLVAFLVQFLPLGMIPFAFRLAGGLVGKVHEFTHGTGKKWAEGIKGNPNDPNSLRNRTTRNLSAAVTRSQSAKLAKLEAFKPPPDGSPPGTEATAPGVFRRTGARVVRTFGGGNASIEFRQAQLNEQAAKQQDALSGHGDDTPIYAAAGYAVGDGETYYDRNSRSEVPNDTGRTRYFTSKGVEISGSQYSAGKQRGGKTIAGLGQAYRYTLQKAQDDTDIEANRFAFKRNAEKGGWSQSDVNGIFPAADYPNKGPFLDEWYSKPVMKNGELHWDDVANNQGQFSKMNKEMNRTRQPHIMGAGRDRGFRIAAGWQKTFEDRLQANNYTDQKTNGVVTRTATQLRQDDLDELARTYQNFDTVVSDMYGGATPGEGAGVVPTMGSGRGAVASGATSEAKGVIEAAVRGRRFAMGERQTDGRREIYYDQAPAGGAAGPVNRVRVGFARPGDDEIRGGGDIPTAP